MSDTSKTHRCIDCPQYVEHTPQELCPSCGRCALHCHGSTSTDPAQLELVDAGLIHAKMSALVRKES